MPEMEQSSITPEAFEQMLTLLTKSMHDVYTNDAGKRVQLIEQLLVSVRNFYFADLNLSREERLAFIKLLDKLKSCREQQRLTPEKMEGVKKAAQRLGRKSQSAFGDPE